MLASNSALSFSILLDRHKINLKEILSAFREDYIIRYNEGLELVTIRNHDQKTIDFALAEMDKLFSDPKYKLDVDLVEAIYRAYASNGKDSFNKLMKLHSDADMMEEKNRLERSISSVKSSEDFEKVLDFILR